MLLSFSREAASYKDNPPLLDVVEGFFFLFTIILTMLTALMEPRLAMYSSVKTTVGRPANIIIPSGSLLVQTLQRPQQGRASARMMFYAKSRRQ